MFLLFHRIRLLLLVLSDLRFELIILLLVLFELKFDQLEQVLEFSAVIQILTNFREAVIFEEDVQTEIRWDMRFQWERILRESRSVHVFKLPNQFSRIHVLREICLHYVVKLLLVEREVRFVLLGCGAHQKDQRVKHYNFHKLKK